MFAAIALTAVFAAATTPARSLPELQAAWYNCLISSAQPEVDGREMPVVIALHAMAACKGEQVAYEVPLLRDRAPNASPDLLVREDAEAVRHVIAFVNRSR
jgi:hypothetical protein